jgi:hypothetical protein
LSASQASARRSRRHAQAVEQRRADVRAEDVVGGHVDAELGEHVREGRVMSEAESTMVPSRSNSTADQVRVGRDGLGGHGESP